MEIYQSVKEYDIPDSYIVRHIFPKHHIYISYRKWMTIKHGEEPVTSGQLNLFDKKD